MNTEKDLTEQINLGDYGNFSIGLQYSTNTYDYGETNKTIYDYYSNLLYNTSELALYNFRKTGFGTEELYGGNINVK